MGYNPWMTAANMYGQNQGQDDPGSTPQQPSMTGSVGSGAATGGIYGALAGLGNYALFEKPAYDRKLQLAATTQRLSPLTHMKAQAPNEVNPMGSVLSMASVGAKYGQNSDAAKQQNAMNNAYVKYLDSFSPGKGSAAPTTTGGYSSGYGLPGAPYDTQQPNLPPSYLQYGGWYGSGGNQ